MAIQDVASLVKLDGHHYSTLGNISLEIVILVLAQIWHYLVLVLLHWSSFFALAIDSRSMCSSGGGGPIPQRILMSAAHHALGDAQTVGSRRVVPQPSMEQGIELGETHHPRTTRRLSGRGGLGV